MTRNRWTHIGAALLILALAGTSLAAEKTSALAQVPAGSKIVVYVRGWEGARERLVTMLKNALPDLAPQLEAQLNGFIQKASDGRRLKGLPKDGAIFLTMGELPGPGSSEEKIVILAQIDSYEAFRDGLLKPEERQGVKKGPAGIETATIGSTETYFVNKNGFAAVTPSKEYAESIAKGGPGLDKGVAPSLAKQLLAADVAVYVDMAAVNKQYGEQIKQFREQFEKALEMGGANLPPNQKNYLELARQMFAPMFQGIEDSNSFLVTANFHPQGLGYHTSFGFRKDTKTSKLLEAVQSSNFPDLDRLPTGAMGYAGVRMSKELFDRLMPMVFGLVMDANSPEGKAMQQAIAEMSAAGPGATVMSFRFPMQGVAVAEYAHPEKAADAQLKIYKAMQGGTQFQGASLKAPPIVQPNAETYRGFKFHHVSMTWDFEKSMELYGNNVPEEARKKMAAAMHEMMGQGIDAWFGTDGKVFLTLTAKDWAMAKKLADDYLNKKETASSTFEETRKHLPKEAVVFYILDLPRFGSIMSKMMLAAMPAGGPNIRLAEPSGKPSYFGIAVTARPEHIGFDVWLPVTTVQEIHKMIEPMLTR